MLRPWSASSPTDPPPGAAADTTSAQHITTISRRPMTPQAVVARNIRPTSAPSLRGAGVVRQRNQEGRLGSFVVTDPTLRASPQDLALVERLRAGDEEAYMTLVEQHQAMMLRIARMYVSSQAVAEDVVADAWIAILRGLDGFEGRSSLRTWMYRILANIAKTRGVKEGRSQPFSSLVDQDTGPSVPESWFRGADDARAGGWSTFPNDWRGLPEDRLLAAETLQVVGEAIDSLPPVQAEVIRLRDVLGWTSEEVRNALDLSETNQRVLLHRARARVRRAVDEYLEKGQRE